MRIDIKKEVKKLDLEAELTGEVNGNLLTSIMQLINAVRCIKHNENIASDLTNRLINDYFIRINSETKTMEFDRILEHDNIYFNVTFVHAFGCCISLSLKDSYNDKIFVEYNYSFSCWDGNITPYQAAGMCVKEFLSRYNCLEELKSGKIKIRSSNTFNTDITSFEEFNKVFKLDLS